MKNLFTPSPHLDRDSKTLFGEFLPKQLYYQDKIGDMVVNEEINTYGLKQQIYIYIFLAHIMPPKCVCGGGGGVGQAACISCNY